MAIGSIKFAEGHISSRKGGFLNDMRLHIFTLLSSNAETVIKFVREWRSKEEICKFFMDEFDISERLAEEYYLDIIEPLIKNGIIASDELSSASHFTPLSTQNNHEMTDEENDMLQYMVMNNIFWGVTLELTFSCNLRCPHCYISKQNRQEMSTGVEESHFPITRGKCCQYSFYRR